MVYNDRYTANEPPLNANGCAMMLITPMDVTDIAAVMEIEKHSQLEPWSKEAFLQELSQPFSYVYVARFFEQRAQCQQSESDRELGFSASLHRPPGGISGYICLWNIADEVQILNLAVHRSYRKQGIGRTLLLYGLKAGCERNARLAVLEVRKSNIAARMLYQSVGFRPVGERPDYYGVHKEPAVLMELEMDDRWKSCWLPETLHTTKE